VRCPPCGSMLRVLCCSLYCKAHPPTPKARADSTKTPPKPLPPPTSQPSTPTELLERGMGSIKKQLKRLVRKGEMAEGIANEVVGRVRAETTLEVGLGAGAWRGGVEGWCGVAVCEVGFGESGGLGSLLKGNLQAQAAARSPNSHATNKLNQPHSINHTQPTTPIPQSMKDVDFVIEAVTENEEVKRAIFQKLDKVRGGGLMGLMGWGCVPCALGWTV